MTVPPDRRHAERFPVNPDTVCHFVSPVVEEFGPLKVLNVSTDGIGLLLMRRVEAGALLAVGLSNKARNYSRTFLVRVIHATAQVGGTYLVGGKFEPALPYEELRQLVM